MINIYDPRNNEITFNELKYKDIFVLRSNTGFGIMKVLDVVNMCGLKTFKVSLPDHSEVILDNAHYMYNQRVIVMFSQYKSKTKKKKKQNNKNNLPIKKIA